MLGVCQVIEVSGEKVPSVAMVAEGSSTVLFYLKASKTKILCDPLTGWLEK
jgi:hypothetical protein